MSGRRSRPTSPGNPGFQLAADALKLNPKLKVGSCAGTRRPGPTPNDKIYTWYKNTILAAYRQYGYLVNYVTRA